MSFTGQHTDQIHQLVNTLEFLDPVSKAASKDTTSCLTVSYCVIGWSQRKQLRSGALGS
jgi:hypothetical protein